MDTTNQTDQTRITQIDNAIQNALRTYLQIYYPHLLNTLQNHVNYLGVGTPEAIAKYIPELTGEMTPRLDDFGVGNAAGIIAGQKNENILYSLGGGLNLLDLLSHEIGHRANDFAPTWIDTFMKWPYPSRLDNELTRKGYLTSPSYERMRKSSEQNADSLKEWDKKPMGKLPQSDLDFLDRSAKEEFFLRLAMPFSANTTTYLDTPRSEGFLSSYLSEVSPEDKSTIDYITSAYRNFLKYGPTAGDFK